MKPPIPEADVLRAIDAVGEHAVLVCGPQEHPTKPKFYVMHPVMLLESRIANVADLEDYQNEKGCLQARMSIWIDVERVLSLAEHRRGLVALRQYGLDILAAIPVEHNGLPPAFREQRLRRCREKLEATSS